MVAHQTQPVYMAKNTLNRGKQWLMNNASSTALAACKDGNAPNGSGDWVKLVVYMSNPKILSIRARPAGDPGMSYAAGTKPFSFSYQGGVHGKKSCIVTPRMLIQPKVRAKTGVVFGAAKMNIHNEHPAGAAKWMMPYGSQARISRTTN